MPGPNLQGFTVAVTADRRRDEQAVLLERLGVEVLMFPLLRTEPEDTGALRALTEEIVKQPPAYFLANTGYGMRTWFAQAAEWGLRDDLVAALRPGTLIAARGAKALGELRKVGLDAWYKAPGETLEEVVARLCDEDLAGQTVVVQLHGEPAGETLAGLVHGGAKVSYLPVYRMGGAGTEAAPALVQALVDGTADVVTFTAAPQVEALAGEARARGVLGQVTEGFNEGGVVAACIGTVCAAAARAVGITNPLVPEHSRLGSLASAIGEELSRRRATVSGRSGPVVISGRLVEAGGEQRYVTGAELRALRALCVRPGDWVARELLDEAKGNGAAANEAGANEARANQDEASGVLANLARVLDGGAEVTAAGARLVRL